MKLVVVPECSGLTAMGTNGAETGIPLYTQIVYTLDGNQVGLYSPGRADALSPAKFYFKQSTC